MPPCNALGPYDLPCLRPDGHPGPHVSAVEWISDDSAATFRVLTPAGDYDEAPTQKLPPIRDTFRRRPPPPAAAAVREQVHELTERAELLRTMVDELAAYDDEDRPE